MLVTDTERLIIRKLNVEDAAFVLELVNDADFIKNIADKGIHTLGEAERFIREGSWTNQPRPGHGQFGMQLKSSGALTGIAGILYRESLDLSDVGFALLPGYRGLGLAYEAASALMDYGRRELGLEAIGGLTVESNKPSIGLLEKLGLCFERNLKLSDDDPGTALYLWKQES